jgi:hypothetical protein
MKRIKFYNTHTHTHTHIRYMDKPHRTEVVYMIKERGGKEAQISSSGYSTRYSPRWAAIALTRNTFIKSSTRD